jgi:hypothetical protein
MFKRSNNKLFLHDVKGVETSKQARKRQRKVASEISQKRANAF